MVLTSVNTIDKFLNGWCAFVPDGHIETLALYWAYEVVCAQQGWNAKAYNQFVASVSSYQMITIHRVNNQSYFKGLLYYLASQETS